MAAGPSWKAVEEAFHEALDVDSPSRPAFLDRRCAGDAALRSEVEQLLVGHSAADHAFITPPDDPPPHPTQIGRFRILRLIASGGMGSVYEAKQDSPNRTVAIKVLRAGLATPTLFRRFTQEAEVLARLRHPGIAQIYEAGMFDSVPFFAMEFIDTAQPITTFARSLSVPAILDLFLRVCDAVHHGHQRGVIHRDLKPGNILVDQSGAPKVIDFGIARAMGSPDESMHTSDGQMIGTLAYMSPEQCAGDPAALDIRTDVYSLGVVLYELLCGRTPFDSGGKPPLEVARAIREDTPPRPSTLAKALRGDLETIILTAIDRDRTRRYQSVAEFASDIARFRNHQTISARPASPAYQLRLFARRNRALAAGAAIALTGLLLGTTGAIWQAVRATDEASRAKRAERAALDEADTATRIAKCLQDAIASIDPRVAAGDGLARAAILHTSAESVARELKDKPLAQATLFERLGDAYAGLGLPDRAAAMYKPASKLLTDQGAPLKDRIRVDAALATSFRLLGQWEDSEQFCRTILGFPAEPGIMLQRVTAGRNLAILLMRRHQTAEAQLVAETTLRDALTLNLPGGNQIVDARLELASILETRGSVEAARAQLTQAVSGAPAGLFTPLALFELGVFEARQNRQEASAAAFTAAINSWRSTASRDRESAYFCMRIAYLLESNGRWQGSEPFFREAIDRYIELYGPRHITVGELNKRLADALQFLNRPQEAAACYREATAILRAIVGDEHPDVGACLYHQARIAAADKDETTLRHLQDEAAMLERASAKLPADHPHRSGLLLLTGFIDMHLDQAAAAEPRLRECARLRTQQLGPESKITVYAQTVLGECLARLGRFEEAEALLQQFVPRVEATYFPGSYMAVEARQRLVDLYTAWGKPDQAQAAREKH